MMVGSCVTIRVPSREYRHLEHIRGYLHGYRSRRRREFIGPLEAHAEAEYYQACITITDNDPFTRSCLRYPAGCLRGTTIWVGKQYVAPVVPVIPPPRLPISARGAFNVRIGKGVSRHKYVQAFEHGGRLYVVARMIYVDDNGEIEVSPRGYVVSHYETGVTTGGVPRDKIESAISDAIKTLNQAGEANIERALEEYTPINEVPQ